MCPANLISGHISNFLFEIVMLSSLQRSSTILVWLTSSSSFLAQIIVYSTNSLAHLRPSTMMSELHKYLNLTCGSRNVVIWELFGLSNSW